MVSEAADARTSVVIATRDRCDGLMTTLARLTGLPERPPVIVVDNGSTDETSRRVVAEFPGVQLIRLTHNIGAPARNVGARAATTDYVAFADDDSWWAPGALRRAADHLDVSPRMAVLQSRILVGAEDRLDPVCAEMAASPLGVEPDLPGPTLLGFVACGAVVRRDAFLDAGGFDDLLFFLGEEQLLAQDLAAKGLKVAYVDDVVAHHHPSPVRDGLARRRREVRNELLAAWMRRSWTSVAATTASCIRSSVRDGTARGGLGEAALRLPAALRRRKRLPRHLEQQISLLERSARATA